MADCFDFCVHGIISSPDSWCQRRDFASHIIWSLCGDSRSLSQVLLWDRCLPFLPRHGIRNSFLIVLSDLALDIQLVLSSIENNRFSWVLMTCYGHFRRGWRAKWPALSKGGHAFLVLPCFIEGVQHCTTQQKHAEPCFLHASSLTCLPCFKICSLFFPVGLDPCNNLVQQDKCTSMCIYI